jgi:hypothetical protein
MKLLRLMANAPFATGWQRVDNGPIGARLADREPRLFVRAFIFEEVWLVVRDIVHRAARCSRHGPQCQILDGRSIGRGGMPFDVRQIDQEVRFLDGASDVEFGQVAMVIGMCHKPLFVNPRRWIDRAADGLGSVAAHMGRRDGGSHIGDERLPTALQHSLHHLSHENRMDDRVTNIEPQVHLDCDALILDALTHPQPLQDQIELGWQRFLGLESGLVGRSPVYFNRHNLVSLLQEVV